MSNVKHVFAVCAYRESPYLEECVKSLLAQTVKSEIFLSTSTPNEHISAIAEKYHLPLKINTGEGGITGDWNFAVSQCGDADFVTIANQDDVYDPTYTEKILQKAEGKQNPILIFCEYFEVRNGERVYKNKLLRIKKCMNFGFRFFPRSRFVRRRILSVGNSICCPAVTYSKGALEGFLFDKRFRFGCDWDAWERLSLKKGRFLYLKQPLMGHRIHEESATTALTQDGRRAEEEYLMFCRFWPAWIAKRLARSYAKGADSNDL